MRFKAADNWKFAEEFSKERDKFIGEQGIAFQRFK